MSKNEILDNLGVILLQFGDKSNYVEESEKIYKLIMEEAIKVIDEKASIWDNHYCDAIESGEIAEGSPKAKFIAGKVCAADLIAYKFKELLYKEENGKE